MAAEKAGIPAVSVLATAFMAQGRAFAKGLGVANPAIAEYPGVPMVDSDDQLYEKVADKVLPRVLDERSKELLREFGRINAEDVRHDLTTE